jgi:hypothetical protein
MTEQQFYLLIGIPSGITVLGMLVSVFLFESIISRLKSFENRVALNIKQGN